jgi:CxxC-x17-CxxC domain-containing protein
VGGSEVAFADRTLRCVDCGKDFVFTAGEQEFYARKGFANDPLRCKDCREIRRRARENPAGPREMFAAVCTRCGAQTQVPFRPRGDRPVYCQDCFRQVRAQRPTSR